MTDDTSHALTPRNPREAIGLAMLHKDMASPLLVAFGGIDPLWSLDKWHPANIAGLFAVHDRWWDLWIGGMIIAESSWQADTDLKNGIIHLADIDLAALPYPADDPLLPYPDCAPLAYAREKFPPDTLRRQAEEFFVACEIWGTIRKPKPVDD